MSEIEMSEIEMSETTENTVNTEIGTEAAAKPKRRRTKTARAAETGAQTAAKDTSEAKSSVRKFNKDDTIVFKSVTAGKLFMVGKKTGNVYSWINYGDEQEIEYQDFQALRLSKSKYIYSPLIVTDDEDILSQFADVKKIYDTVYSYDEITELLKQPPDVIKGTLKTLPKGILNSVKTIAADQIATGRLDSIKKIKALDSVLGTDLSVYIE